MYYCFFWEYLKSVFVFVGGQLKIENTEIQNIYIKNIKRDRIALSLKPEEDYICCDLRAN